MSQTPQFLQSHTVMPSIPRTSLGIDSCVTVLPSCARRWPEPLDPQTKVQVAPAAVSRQVPVVPLGASSVGQAGPADTASPQSRPTVSKICVTCRPPSAGAADCSVLAQEEDVKVDHAAEHAALHVVGLHTTHGWQASPRSRRSGAAHTPLRQLSRLQQAALSGSTRLAALEHPEDAPPRAAANAGPCAPTGATDNM